MSLRWDFPEARPPESLYCLSLSHGRAMHSVRVGRAGVLAIAALGLVALAWTTSVTLYIAFHDDVIGAILARQGAMKAAYEESLAEARAGLDQAESRRLLDRNAFNGSVQKILSRQAKLDQRGAIIVALAEAEGRNRKSASTRPGARPAPADALNAIDALGPSTTAGASVDDAARAYAPLPAPQVEPRQAEPRLIRPHPIEEPGETLSALPSEAPFTTASVRHGADDLEPSARLMLIGRALDGIENGQTTALASIDRAASRLASRDAAIVAETGLDPARLSLPRGAGGVGGPFIPRWKPIRPSCASRAMSPPQTASRRSCRSCPSACRCPAIRA